MKPVDLTWSAAWPLGGPDPLGRIAERLQQKEAFRREQIARWALRQQNLAYPSGGWTGPIWWREELLPNHRRVRIVLRWQWT